MTELKKSLAKDKAEKEEVAEEEAGMEKKSAKY